jgi:hypothetical protein
MELLFSSMPIIIRFSWRLLTKRLGPIRAPTLYQPILLTVRIIFDFSFFLKKKIKIY